MIDKAKEKIEEAEVIVIGAGSGLSTSAGYVYTGERMDAYFFDFRQKYGFQDMYSGGFYPFETMEEFWGYWCRYIWINRYAPIPKKEVYTDLLDLVKDRDYFVLTTNVDHCFQRSGFDKQRLFYTQGDYGLLQSRHPIMKKTYDNYDIIKEMVDSEGWSIKEDNTLYLNEGVTPKMTVPSHLVPLDARHRPMTTNLRADDTFVEDEGWHRAKERYVSFLSERLKKKIVFLELGVGMNTPGIIKYPFWRLVNELDDAFYISINHGEAYAPVEIEEKSICINGDIGETIQKINHR